MSETNESIEKIVKFYGSGEMISVDPYRFEWIYKNEDGSEHKRINIAMMSESDELVVGEKCKVFLLLNLVWVILS